MDNQPIFKILSSTPLWVWAVLAYLFFVGVKATRKRWVYIPKMFIVPLVLVGIKYKTFLLADVWAWSAYGICLGLGLLLGYRMTKLQDSELSKEGKSICLPGSYQLLCILLLFFCVKYYFGYMRAVDYAHWLVMLPIEMGVGGLFSGYLFGKALRYWGYVRAYFVT